MRVLRVRGDAGMSHLTIDIKKYKSAIKMQKLLLKLPIE